MEKKMIFHMFDRQDISVYFHAVSNASLFGLGAK